MKKTPRLHCLVSDFFLAEQAILGGAELIQYRNKKFSPEKDLSELREIVAMCKENQVLCLINDYPQWALETDADGVHIGIKDEPLEKVITKFPKEKIIGFTVHNEEELGIASLYRERISYIGVGSVFPSPTKKVKTLGLQKFKHICRLSKIPVIGIGGISQENICQVLEAGAYGVAVISAFTLSDAPARAVSELLRKIATCRQPFDFEEN